MSSLSQTIKHSSSLILLFVILRASIGQSQSIIFPSEQITVQTINRITLLNSFPVSDSGNIEITALQVNYPMDIVYVGDTSGTLSSWTIPQGNQYLYSFTANEAGIDPVGSIAVSPNNNYVAAAYNSGTVNVFDLRIFPIHNSLQLQSIGASPFYSSSLEFSPSGILAFSMPRLDDHTNSTYSSVRLWDMDSMVISSIPITEPIQALAFSSDNRVLAIAYGHQIQLWDMVTGESIASIDLRNDSGEWNVVSLVFSPDGNMLAAGTIGVFASTNSYVFVWQVSDLIQNPSNSSTENATHLLWHGDRVNDIDFSVDSTLLVSASGSGTVGGVRVWDVSANLEREQEPLLVLAEGDAYSVDVAEWFIVAGGRDGLVRVWGISNPEN